MSSCLERLTGHLLTIVTARYLHFSKLHFGTCVYINVSAYNLFLFQIEEFRQIARDAEDAIGMRDMNSQAGRSVVRRIFDTAMKGLRRFGCARDDDVVTRPYRMPEAPSSRYDMPELTSSRPSLARTTNPRRSVAGPSTTPLSYPRHDSSLLHRSYSGQPSQVRAATQVLFRI